MALHEQKTSNEEKEMTSSHPLKQGVSFSCKSPRRNHMWNGDYCPVCSHPECGVCNKCLCSIERDGRKYPAWILKLQQELYIETMDSIENVTNKETYEQLASTIDKLFVAKFSRYKSYALRAPPIPKDTGIRAGERL